MRLSLVSLFLLLVTMWTGSAGAFKPRSLVLESGGRWIGNAICYGPYRDGQRPGEGSPTPAELREDLQLMLPHWRLLRVYGSSEFAENLLNVIRDDRLDMKMMLGAWIAADAAESNRSEVDAAIRLANAYPDIVVAVIIGNETQVSWAAHRCPPELLLELLHRVRAKVSVPVTTADDIDFWIEPESRAIAAEIDFIMLHAHPMWNGVLLDGALPWLKEQLAEVRELHPERPIVIGETGWATSVHDEGEQAELINGKPGEAEQRRFYDAARSWAEMERQPLFIFEAFDENWKGGQHPAEVEKHWGLFTAGRAAKSAVARPD